MFSVSDGIFFNTSAHVGVEDEKDLLVAKVSIYFKICTASIQNPCCDCNHWKQTETMTLRHVTRYLRGFFQAGVSLQTLVSVLRLVGS